MASHLQIGLADDSEVAYFLSLWLTAVTWIGAVVGLGSVWWFIKWVVFLVLMHEISGSDGFSWISFSRFASKLDGFVRFGCFVKVWSSNQQLSKSFMSSFAFINGCGLAKICLGFLIV